MELNLVPSLQRWSQEETDHLFDLCQRFDLRFIVIADQYASEGSFPERTVEELKERYYAGEPPPACEGCI